jgi:hypothetical protein
MMTNDEFNVRMALLADRLEDLGERFEAAEISQSRDRELMERGIVRIDRLERLVKLIVRLGDRERKELRERINALIDSHLRLEDGQAKIQESFNALLNSHIRLEDEQRKAEESRSKSERQVAQAIVAIKESQRLSEESRRQFEQQVGQALIETKDSQRLSEESRRQFEQQVGQALIEMKDSQRLSEESFRKSEESRRQFEQQVGQALAEMALAITKTNHRIDTIENNGHP